MPSQSEIQAACSRWFRKHCGVLVLIFVMLVLHSCTTQQIETVRQEADSKINRSSLILQRQLQDYQQKTTTVLNDLSRAQVNIGKISSTTINDHSRMEIGNVNVKVEAPNYGTTPPVEPTPTAYKPKPNPEQPKEVKP